MKPRTIEALTKVIIEEIKGELKELVDLTAFPSKCSSEELLAATTNCRNIIDVAEALENVLLTAADELDRLEADILNGEQLSDLVDLNELAASADNVKRMTPEKHDEAHTWLQ